MTKVVRQVIKIDEELCNGCGHCVSACSEGAIEIINGKAKLVSDIFCDGLGACIGKCPTGALTFETREADAFDEEAVKLRLKEIGREPKPEHHQDKRAEYGFVHHDVSEHTCPSARSLVFDDDECECSLEKENNNAKVRTALRQWPVKLRLVNPNAPYFKDAELLVSADCVPFAYANIHPDFLKGKSLVTGCPKFDDIEQYRRKLTEIFRNNDIKSVTVLRMEVPCCGSLTWLLKDAIAASSKNIPMKEIVITLKGELQ